MQTFKSNRMPWFLPILFGITLVYLVVEICFASFLVELLGSQADHDAIERAEHAGRIISGIAVALAIWGFQIPRLSIKRPFKFVAAIGLSATLSILGVYHGERWIIDQTAATTPYANRQQALRALAVKEALFIQTPAVIGIDPPASSQNDATWAAFRGLFPFISLYQEDVLSKHTDGVAAAVEAGIDATVPDAHAFDEDVLGALFVAMEERYDAYREAVSGRDEAIGRANGRIRNAWDQNVEAMRSGRMTISRLRRAVQSRGVPVPNNWHPTDQETFQRAAWRPVMEDINGAYNDAIARILGRSVAVPPDLQSYEAFLAHPGVQDAMRADLGLRTPGAKVMPGLRGDALEALHREYVSALGARLQDVYLGDTTALRRGEEFQEVGEQAFRALIVPPIALSLSLLGAAVHLVKFLNYLTAMVVHGRSRFGIRRFLLSHPKLRFCTAVAGAVAIIVATYTPASAIVDSAYYQEATKRMEQNFPNALGMPITVGLDLTISMQSIVAPAGNAVRSLGVFSPIEDYLDAGDIGIISTASVGVVDIPFPTPRPEWRVADAGNPIPLPRPRPDRD